MAKLRRRGFSKSPEVLIFAFALALNFVNCQESSQELFQKNQKYLEELQKFAKDGGHSDSESITKYDSEVCYTTDCIETAREFLFAVNFTENPCNSGSWLKFVCVRRTMSKEESGEIDDLNEQGQVGFLGTVALGQTAALLDVADYPSNAMKQAKIYYSQCEEWMQMDNDAQVDAIVNYLNLFGEWPLLTGKDSPGSTFDWKTMMANTIRITVAYGVAPYLFDIFIEENDMPLIFTGELNLHKDVGEISEIIKILSKGKRNVTDDDPQIKEMEEFMSKLTHPSEDKIASYTVKNITSNNDFGKDFDLAQFTSTLLSGTRVQVTPDSTVSTDVDWLVKHVRAVNEANPRIIANILFLQEAAALLTRLTKMSQNRNLPTLQKYRRDGPMDCLQETDEKFDNAMSYEFIRRYYDHEGTPTLVQLLEDLQYGYVETLKKVPFLTSQTRVHAIDKAKYIHTYIAADDWVMDPDKLNEYYRPLNMTDKQNFVTNHVAGLRFHWVKFLELKNPTIFSYLVGDAYTGFVSSKYSYHFNQLRVQAALVQKPLFSQKYPGFMNYGGIGTVLSHSLGHSFDTNGVHFDKEGHHGDFWDDMSYEGYYNWTDSLIADYSKDEYKQMDPWGSYIDADIDHAEAINDDIADIVGIHMANRAYQKYLEDLSKSGKKELVLPGLKQFTPNQLFWMKYANIWCEHTEKSYLHALRDFSMHSPGNVRATLPISRSKQWAEDFGCPAPAKSEF